MPIPVVLPPLLSDLRTKLLAPPVDPSPVTRDPRYQELRVEIAKLESPASAPPKWAEVATKGAALLQESEKHLQVAAYTAAALTELHGPAGMSLGVDLLTQLLPLPELAPTSAKGRGLALFWFIQRLTQRLSTMTAEAIDAPFLRPLPGQLKSLRSAAVEHIGDRAPAFGGAIRASESLCLDLPAPEADPSGAAQAGEGAVSDDTPIATELAAGPIEEKTLTAVSLAAPSPAAPSPAAPSSAAPSSAAPSPADTTPPANPRPSSLDPAANKAATREATDPLAEFREEAAPWLAPIAPDSPCGDAPDPLESFIELRNEFAKLTSVTQTPIEWRLVKEQSDQLLRETSKDLRLAAYLMLAEHHERGLHGLILGLVVAAELLARYPGTLHPKRPKSRGNFAEWLIVQAGAALSQIGEAISEPEHRALVSARKHLAAVFAEHLGDRAPSQRPLRDAIKKIAVAPEEEQEADSTATQTETETETETEKAEGEKAEAKSEAKAESSPSVTDPTAAETKVAADPTPTRTADAKSTIDPVAVDPKFTAKPAEKVAVKPAAAAAPLADLGDLDRFLDATDDALAATARALRDALPADPRGYRLLRIALWLKLIAPPPTKPDGNTHLQPLQDRDRDQLETLLAKQQWAGLIQRSESLLPRNRYLLDLQRYSCAALEGLGEEYAAAAVALRAEVTALLVRFPSLPKLRDRSGRPLADAETERWIAERLLPTMTTQPAGAAAAQATLPAALAQTDDDLTFWAGLTSQLQSPTTSQAALTSAQAYIDSSPTGTIRFTRSLKLAVELARGGVDQHAAYLLRGLSDEAERSALVHWDKPLFTRCLIESAALHRKMKNTAAYDETCRRLAPICLSAIPR